MGRKSREAMEAARRSLEARKTADLGPTAPPCANCGEPSTGTVFVPSRHSAHTPGLTDPAFMRPACSPLRCAATMAGDRYGSATWAPHPPNLYRRT